MKVSSAIPMTAPRPPIEHLEKQLEGRSLYHVDKAGLLDTVRSGSDPVVELESVARDLRTRQQGSKKVQRLCKIGAWAALAGAIGGGAWGVVAGHTGLGVGGGVAGLVGAAVLGVQSANAHDRVDALQHAEAYIKGLGYEMQRLTTGVGDRTQTWHEIQAKGPTPEAQAGLAGLVQELGDAGIRWLSKDDGSSPELPHQVALERVLAGETIFFASHGKAAYPISRLEDLQFLDFARGGAPGDGLTDPGLARAIMELVKEGHTPQVRRGETDPLAVYNQATGRAPKDFEASFGHYLTPVTAEKIKAHAFFKGSGLDHGLADPDLGRGLKELADRGYKPAGIRVDYGQSELEIAYHLLVSGQKRHLEVRCPPHGISVPAGANEIREPDLLQQRAVEVEKLYDTHLAGLRDRLGDRFATTEFLSVAYGLEDTGHDVRVRTRVLASLFEAESHTRLQDSEGKMTPLGRAREDFMLLHRRTDSAEELRSGARVLADLLKSLPRHHALDGARVVFYPIGESTLEDRADLFVEHMYDETFTVRSRELDAAPGKLANLYLEGYIDKAAARFASDDSEAVVKALRSRLQADSHENLAIEIQEENVVVGGVAVRRRAGNPG